MDKIEKLYDVDQLNSLYMNHFAINNQLDQYNSSITTVCCEKENFIE